MKGAKRLLLKEPKIKKEKPLSGEKPQPGGGRSAVEGGAGSKLGCNDPAVGKGLGIHHVHFIAHIFHCKCCPLWDASKCSCLALMSAFLIVKRSSTGEAVGSTGEPRVGCLMRETALESHHLT